MHTRRAAKHDEIEQRVAAQPISAVHRYAGDLSHRVQTLHRPILVAVFVARERLPVHPGGDAAHHVVAGGHDRNGLPYGIDMRERARQIENARQTAVQHLLAQVIELEQDMIRFRAATPAFSHLK